MPNQPLVSQVADAVAGILALGEFSQSFTPARTQRPDKALESLGANVQVMVMATSMSSKVVDRDDRTKQVSVAVGVMKKLSQITEQETAEIDAMLALVQELDDYLFERRDDGALEELGLNYDSSEMPLIYDQQRLNEQRVFLTELVVHYKQA
jgi:hypothetical protein